MTEQLSSISYIVISWDFEAYTCLVVELLSHVQQFSIPQTVVCQTPLSMGLPKQEYWSGLPFSSPIPVLGAYFPLVRASLVCMTGSYVETFHKILQRVF